MVSLNRITAMRKFVRNKLYPFTKWGRRRQIDYFRPISFYFKFRFLKVDVSYLYFQYLNVCEQKDLPVCRILSCYSLTDAISE